jgi:hypothetical protein
MQAANIAMKSVFPLLGNRRFFSQLLLICVYPRSSAVLTALSASHHSKNGQAENQRKFLSIKVKDGLSRALKNVLTEKRSLFSGHLAEKRGVCALKKPFFLVFFRFWGICSHGRY